MKEEIEKHIKYFIKKFHLAKHPMEAKVYVLAIEQLKDKLKQIKNENRRKSTK